MEDVLALVLDLPFGLVVLVGLVFAFYKAWIVPGPIFRREVERGNALSDTNHMQAEIINRSTAALEKLTDGQELTLDVVQRLDERSRREGKSP